MYSTGFYFEYLVVKTMVNITYRPINGKYV